MGKVLWVEDAPVVRTEKSDATGRSASDFDEWKEQALVRCLKVGTPDELRMAVGDIFDSFAEPAAARKEMQISLLMVLAAVLKTAKEAHVNLDDWFGELSIVEIFRLYDLPAVKGWLYEVCLVVQRQMIGHRQHTFKEIIKKAISYTREHYGDPTISVQRICSQLHVSSGYFSSLFKKEVKMTFVHYVMNIRMEKAMELLRSTELKAFEIAERVGFANPHYFSFCFKKRVGVSPSEYRAGAVVEGPWV